MNRSSKSSKGDGRIPAPESLSRESVTIGATLVSHSPNQHRTGIRRLRRVRGGTAALNRPEDLTSHAAI
jgi:hypothetical protein